MLIIPMLNNATDRLHLVRGTVILSSSYGWLRQLIDLSLNSLFINSSTICEEMQVIHWW